jgi:Ca2+-binding RTX toxin-like protein
MLTGGRFVMASAGSAQIFDARIYTGDETDETVIGGSLGDTIEAGGGGDSVRGEAGDDRFIAQWRDGNDRLAGGDGFDWLDYSAVTGHVEVDLLAGLATGSAGRDTLIDRFEYVVGSASDDVLAGSHMTDALSGGLGHDRLFGNGGDDLIRGGEGEDTVHAATADGNDRLAGGDGFDRLDYSGTEGPVEVNLMAGTTHGSAGQDTLQDRFEHVVGSASDDVLAGSHMTDALSGGAGNDRLFGNGGDDRLAGGAGHDTIVLGPGRDTCFFAAGDGIDTLADFVPGEDMIDLRAYGGLRSFSHLLDEGRLTTLGGRAAILLDGGDMIWLEGVASHTHLAPADFLI